MALFTESQRANRLEQLAMDIASEDERHESTISDLEAERAWVESAPTRPDPAAPRRGRPPGKGKPVKDQPAA